MADSIMAKALPPVLAAICVFAWCGGNGHSSPGGLEFETRDAGGRETLVSFRAGRDQSDSCYELMDSMGRVIAAACRTADGWDFRGGRGWTFDQDGKVTARLPDDSKIALIYHRTRTADEREALYRFGQDDSLSSDKKREDAVKAAREACSGLIRIPDDSLVRVDIGEKVHRVYFMGGSGDDSSSRCLGMAIVDSESGKVINIAVP